MTNRMTAWLAQWRVDKLDAWRNDWSLEPSEGIFTVAVFFTKKDAQAFIKGCAKGTERIIPILMLRR